MNLGEALEAVYRGIHDDVVDGVATGGDATTITDSTLSGKFQTSKFKNWIAFISRTSDGLSPQNRYAKITAYVATGSATIDTVTDAVAAGDEYAFCKGTIPLYTLIKLFNDAVRKLGRMEQDDVSLTTATDTLRYTLPIETKGISPRAVFLMDEDYNRLDTPNFRIVPAAAGSTEILQFTSQPIEGKTIVYKYMGLHPKLTAYDSVINGRIHPELAIAAGIERAMWWKCQPKRRKIDMENWGQAKALLQEARKEFPIQMPIKESKRVPISMFN